MPPDAPEEDKLIWEQRAKSQNQPAPRLRNCDHGWTEIFYGYGVSKEDHTTAITAFFCERCLRIEKRRWSQAEYYMKDDFDD
jgi:hypothetical protein